jgi:hypothetical protein
MQLTERQLRKLIRESVHDEFANLEVINTEDQSLDRSMDAENAWDDVVSMTLAFIEDLPVTLELIDDAAEYILSSEPELWDLAIDYWDGDESELINQLFNEMSRR